MYIIVCVSSTCVMVVTVFVLISVLMSQVNCPVYIVHVMSKSAAQAVIRGKERGQCPSIIQTERESACLVSTNTRKVKLLSWESLCGCILVLTYS